MNNLKNKIKNKNGSAYLNGLMIVLAMIGIGTIIMTYQDYTKEKNTTQEITESASMQELSNIITIDDSLNAIDFSGGFKYISKISLGELGSGYLSEEIISKELSIYSGKISYKNGEDFGLRLIVKNGEEISIGSSNTKTIPVAFMEYFKEVALKMYEYRYKEGENK